MFYGGSFISVNIDHFKIARHHLALDWCLFINDNFATVQDVMTIWSVSLLLLLLVFTQVSFQLLTVMSVSFNAYKLGDHNSNPASMEKGLSLFVCVKHKADIFNIAKF